MKYILILTFIIPAFVAGQNGKEMITSVNLGDSTIQVKRYVGDKDENILFLNVHEDETTSIEVVEEYSKEYPVNFIRLVHNETRNIVFTYRGKKYEVDPNRMFTRRGRKASLKKFGNYSVLASIRVKRLAKKLVAHIKPGTVIVAMHNNTDVNYSIKSYEPGGDEAENTKEVYVNPEMDADDFIYTTVKQYYDEFKKRGVNVILQDNEKCVNDGSLSVSCGKAGTPYINIEAQKGHFDEQLELIKITLEVIRAGRK